NDSYDRLLFQAFSPRPAGRALHAAVADGRPPAKRAQAEARRVRGRVRGWGRKRPAQRADPRTSRRPRGRAASASAAATSAPPPALPGSATVTTDPGALA